MGNIRTAAFVSESTLKEAINNPRCYFESVYYKHTEHLLEKSATARGKTKMIANACWGLQGVATRDKYARNQ